MLSKKAKKAEKTNMAKKAKKAQDLRLKVKRYKLKSKSENKRL